MGAAAAVVQALSLDSCAKYVCNALSIHSQCCDKEDACNCDLATHGTAVETPEAQEIHISTPWLNIHAQT